ncbi:hypothetical protein ACOME3_007462 [Neoechinorhynchus agilis]
MKDIGEDASPSRSPSWCSATFRDQVVWKLRSAHRSSSDQNHEVENKEIRPEDPGSGERCKHIAKVKWQHSMVDQCIESHLELTISNLPLDATETWIRQMFNTIGIFPSTIKMIERPSDSYIPFKPLAAVTFERQSEMVDCFLRAHLIKYFENSLSHSLHAHRHKSNETRKYLVQSGQEDKEGAALSKNEDSDEEKCQTDEEEEGGIPAAHQMDLSSRVEAMFNITGNSYKQEEQVVEVQEKKMNRDQKQRLVDLCMSEFTPKVQSGTVKGVLQTILVELAQSRLHDVVEVRKSEILMRKRNARTPTNATVDDEDYDLGNDVTTDRVGAEMEHIKSTECTRSNIVNGPPGGRGGPHIEKIF